MMVSLMLGVVVAALSSAWANDHTSCNADGECQVSSPTLVQMRSSRARGSEQTGTLVIHGVPVRNYKLAYVAGKEAHEEQNYNVGPEDPVSWNVDFKNGVSTQQITEFCQNITSESTRCVWSGHPSEGGLELADVIATITRRNEIMRDYSDIIKVIEPDAVDSISLWSMDEEVQGAVPWGLDRIDQANLPLSGSYTSPGKQGEGIRVYVLDTGIRTTHADFNGRAIPYMNAYKEPAEVCAGADDVGCARDGHGHGTHCAGTVAGGKYGVAKKATVLAVKVLSDSGSGHRAGILHAMDEIAKDHDGTTPGVMSMSLGGAGASAVYQDAVDKLLAKNIVTVVAAGNSNKDACDYSPAYVPKAVTVAATTNQDQRSSFSNWGSCIDIFAPGSSVLSAWIRSNTDSRTISGTSMACPHVSGAAALLLSEELVGAQDMEKYLHDTGVRGLVKNPRSPTDSLLQVPTDLPVSTSTPPDYPPGGVPGPAGPPGPPGAAGPPGPPR